MTQKSEDKALVTGQKSGLMRLLGSTKITPILGLAAFLSILYYKNNSAKREANKKQVLRSQVDREAPVFTKREVIGKLREGGPVLTKSFFGQGDLIVRKHKGTLELAVIHKTKQDVKVWTTPGRTSPLSAWLKEADGRLALYRVKIKSEKAWGALASSLRPILQTKQAKASNVLAALVAAYQKAQCKLPTFVPVNQTPAVWVKQLVEQSHYNDLK
jgi:hypothetical protein